MAQRRWWLTGLLILALILNGVDRSIIAVLKPLIDADMHWTDADYGTLVSIFQLSAALSYFGVGWIVDRLGSKWAAPVGVAMWSIAAAAHGWVANMGQFAAARVALGATESIGTPAYVKTVGALFPVARTRSFVFGLTFAVAAIMGIVIPFFLPLIGVTLGWRNSFIFVGAVGLMWSAAWMFVTRGQTFADTGLSTRTKPSLDGIREVLADRRLWGIAGAKALSDQVYWLLLFWEPDFFHRVFGVTVAHLGPPLAIGAVGAALAALATGLAGTHLLGKGYSVNFVRKSTMLVCALMATTIPFSLETDNLWVASCLMAVIIAAQTGFSLSIFSTITDIMPGSRVGTVTSIGALCGNLAGMSIVFAAGQILTAGLGYGPLMAIAAVSYLLGLGWFHLMIPRLELATDDFEAPELT